MNLTKLSPWQERIFLCGAVVISYASVWPNGFVFDDLSLIVGNAFLKHWGDLPRLLANLNFTGGGVPGGFYRPVQMLIYFFIYQAFGASAVAFHALNIGLQALNACLLHHFGIRAGFRKGAAFAAALLWAVHPLHTSDVAYMSSTAELLRSSFCLCGLIALLPDFTPRKVWQAMIFFILALGCKESAIVFPALAAITFFFVSKDRAQVSAYLKIWPFWLLAACYTTVWVLFRHKSGYALDDSGDPVFFREYTSSFINRVLTSLATLPVYARLIVWPTGLHTDRVFSIFSTLLSWRPALGFLMTVLGFLYVLKGRQRALSFGLLWFAVALSPYTGIFMPINALISEGWLYLPTMGLFLGAVQAAAGFFETRQSAARLLVLLLVFSLGLTTFLQNEVWRNTETLYQNIPESEEQTTRLSIFLGPFYMEQGDFDRAIKHFQYEIAHSDGLPSTVKADFHWKLAMAWLHIPPGKNDTFTLDVHALPSYQHIPEAIRELGQTLQDNPDFYPAHAALAALYRYQGNAQMADFHQKQVKAILQKQGGH